VTGWLLLAAAIVAEVAATTTLTYSAGLTRHVLTAVTTVLYVVSYICLARALRADLEISVAYAVWSGVGTAALTIIGVALFGEALNPLKLAAIALIIGGVTLLHVAGNASARAADPTQAATAGTTTVAATAPLTPSTESKTSERATP
jgi:small multidrug resistance pump